MPLNEEQRRLARYFFEELGTPLAEVAELMLVSYDEAYEAVTGLARNAKDTRARIVLRALKAGLTTLEVSDATGITRQTVCVIARRHGGVPVEMSGRWDFPTD